MTTLADETEDRDRETIDARRAARLEWARRSTPVSSTASAPPAAPVPGVREHDAPRLIGDTGWSVDVAAIEQQRIVRGWSRLQLATAAHVDPKTLRDLLGRRRRPNVGTVQAVAVALSLALSDVIKFG